MVVAKTIGELYSSLIKSGGIGFVPTMGALHQGHISLVKKAVSENRVAVCSIFVNPAQFNNPDDLKNYPRTPEKDLNLLESAGCQVVFMPESKEIYGRNEIAGTFNLNPLDTVMEGKYRPGHFHGVASVVKRLFEIVSPQRAYFGEKDFQQIAVIRKMIAVEKLNVAIVECQTVREPDGLAMSSRNIRLSAEERKHSHLIYDALCFAKENKSSMAIEKLIGKCVSLIESCHLFKVEYFEIADEQSLLPVSEINTSKHARAFAAVKTASTRLIDNLQL